jgi:hypothetical protein
MTTQEQRCAAVEAFGYTQRQAQFLVRVALHGGYFLRRQYLAFTGLAHGQASDRFLARAIERGHVRALPFPRFGNVYHLFARPLHAAIGEEHNRNRRLVEAEVLTRKPLALDFVISTPEGQFIATEEDKVALLTELGVWQDYWPSKRYSPRRGRGLSVTRYFVDKMPWVRLPGDDRLWFVYVDSESTLAGVETFVTQYGRLLRVVPCGVIYVGTSAWPAAIRRAMDCGLARAGELGPGRPSAFREYCRIRKLVEAKQYDRLPGVDLTKFRELRKEFGRAAFDDLYARWCEGGEIAVAKAAGSPVTNLTCKLRVDRLRFSYGLKQGPSVSLSIDAER